MSSQDPLDRGWFKSSYSNPSGDCVEVRFTGATVRVRDSKSPDAEATIAVGGPAWSAFVSALIS